MSKSLTTKNVAVVALGVGLVLALSFAFATPAKAQTIAELQAQIQALLAQIAALQGGTTTGGTTSGAGCYTFTRNHSQGDSGGEVMQIQKFLNGHGAQVAASGAGSPGNETSYFGGLTKAAVTAFQNMYAADILAPVGLSAGTGYWGPSSRAKANALCAGAGPVTPGTPTPVPVTGSLNVFAGTQPANSLAPQSAASLPFTTITVTNGSSAAVTVDNVVVQRGGLANDAVFSGVILLNSGARLGNTKTFNSNHQATLEAGITLQPGQSATLTVAGDMAADLSSYTGQVVSISVIGVNTSAAVSGSLPITGASHTVNSSLSLGSVTMSLGSGDPNTTSLNSSTAGKEIGTTNYTAAEVRAQAGSAEDIWVRAIRWNQAGSVAANDLANVNVVVDGTTYPMTISSDGKYYTAVFPGNGIEIMKGLTKDFTVKVDIIGGPNRTIQFDIYKAADITAVGEVYGYAVTPTQGSNCNATANTATDASEYINSATDCTGTAGTPFFSATVIQVNTGTVSSVSRANEVPAQNVVENTANQPLGGFVVDIKGEAITVQRTDFYFGITGGNANESDLTNVTLVDENGAVIAGPADGVDADNRVRFTDTVTFPTGRHVYTLRGQLSTDFGNGDTIQASTTPSTDWSTVRGVVTGDTISLSGLSTAVTGNIMTVRAGSVVLSIGSSPAAQTIVSGSSNLAVASFNFDATQSGEDVKFSSQKLQYSDGLTGGDPTNCFAYDGATRLNSTAVNPTTDGTDYTFTFDTNLVVSKGTVKTISIRCDIPAAITSGTFTFDIDISEIVSGTGLASSQTIAPTSSTGDDQTGNTQTIASSGALTVALDSSSPSASLAAAGTTGVTLSVLRFNGTNEDMRLDRVALQLSNGVASSSPSNVTQITLWDGATQVGTAIFAGTRFATSTLSGTVVIPANGFKTLTVKGDLAGIGTGQATTTNGLVIEVDYDGHDSTGTRAIGQSSGQTINQSSSSDTDVAPTRVYRSYPTFAVLDLPTTALVSGTNVIYRFSITASNSGFGVGIHEITANIATSSITSLDTAELYAFTDSGFSSPVSGFTNGQLDSNSGNATTGDVTFNLGTSELQIPANGTRYFEVRINATLSGSGTEQISTKIQGDSAQAVGSTLTVAAATVVAATDGQFVWSGNATTTSETTHLDWTNGYAVPGLPSGGSSTKTLQKTN